MSSKSCYKCVYFSFNSYCPTLFLVKIESVYMFGIMIKFYITSCIQ